MNTTMLKRFAGALLLALCATLPGLAQNPKLQIDHLDKLFPKAAETIDVRVEGALLSMASKFLRSDKADEAAVKAVKGVYKGGLDALKAKFGG